MSDGEDRTIIQLLERINRQLSVIGENVAWFVGREKARERQQQEQLESLTQGRPGSGRQRQPHSQGD